MKQKAFLEGATDTPRARTRPPKKTGYAARPGTGPEGETCKTCEHYVRVSYHGKLWRKCFLMRRFWTHGPGTDIKAGSPACRKWAQKEDTP